MTDDILNVYLQVSQHVSRQFRLHFGQLNLTFPQALILNALLEEAPVPISSLAQRSGSANSTVSGIVDRLEKLGLVCRERSRLDRRVIYVNLTDRCRAMREDARTDVRGYFGGLLGTLTSEEQGQVLLGLTKLKKALTSGKEGEDA